MKIILKDAYKSLNPFESDELGDLTVITGKNGSGKSQLLELINKKSKSEKTALGIEFRIEPEISFVQAEGIVKDTVSQVNHEQWKKIVAKNIQAYRALPDNAIDYLKYLRGKGFDSAAYKKDPKSPLLSDSEEYKELLNKVHSEILNKPMLPQSEVQWTHQRNVNREILKPKNEAMISFIEDICGHTGKDAKELTDADFYNSPIHEHLIDENDLFASQVEIIFYNYAKRRDQNRKDYFYKREEGEENRSIPDKDFIKSYPPPWDLINEIVNNLKIDFYFKGIEKSDFTIDAAIEFALLKKTTNENVPFNDLSSGEKVIIGLIIKLFTSEYYQEKLSFPELLILDEPDAHLHPEMSKLLLDALHETFSKEYGIRIIITTHSPSTVALAPEESIYEIKNGPNTSLKKISKDDALKILTSFIPTLSIDYKNHKQVFVESPTDRFYFETIFNRLFQQGSYPFRLYFISNGYGKGNCNQVINVVQEIRKSSNSTCYGVIDWDKRNSPSDFVKVHGENQRYSIENYTYDPIYIVILFLEMQALNIHNVLGVDLSFNEYTIGLDEELVENGVKWFFDLYYKKHAVSENEKNRKRLVRYHNGIEVQLPIWYLELRGHDLEDRLKEAFPPLEKYTGQGCLQKKLSIISAKSFPLIHEDTVNVIESIVFEN
ncbi:hypothetical protein CEK62_17500 [Alcanivorax sp. N3-2A]|nr:hypothetical protein CEK62_17500 [Alcanivorax sp. N3-2A]